jgi:hypothetical protein
MGLYETNSFHRLYLSLLREILPTIASLILSTLLKINYGLDKGLKQVDYKVTKYQEWDSIKQIHSKPSPLIPKRVFSNHNVAQTINPPKEKL